jgi:hypothetical protein
MQDGLTSRGRLQVRERFSYCQGQFAFSGRRADRTPKIVRFLQHFRRPRYLESTVNNGSCGAAQVSIVSSFSNENLPFVRIQLETNITGVSKSPMTQTTLLGLNPPSPMARSFSALKAGNQARDSEPEMLSISIRLRYRNSPSPTRMTHWA